jgi:hypothetical protein
MTKGDEIRAHCIKCIFGIRTSNHSVQCTHMFHPGIVGGTGTEWALRCSDYVEDSDKRPKIEQVTITREAS